jgi:L-iditol 2-dehydrogenase
VFIAPKVPCGSCSYCREGHYPQCSEVKERLPGGFAEYILVPEALIEKGAYLLPGSISYDQSTFIEPVACVVLSQKLAGLKEGQSVLVLGCGMSGLLQIQLAKRKGCVVAATDVVEKKREYAQIFGADLVIPGDGEVSQCLTGYLRKKADVVFLCTSALSAVEQAWTSVDKGGAVVFFAVPGPEKTVTVPVNDFWTKEVRILTSYYCGPPDIQEAIELLAAGAIDVERMITHRVPLEDIVRGFQLVLGGAEAVKVIIKPHAKEEGYTGA